MLNACSNNRNHLHTKTRIFNYLSSHHESKRLPSTFKKTCRMSMDHGTENSRGYIKLSHLAQWHTLAWPIRKTINMRRRTCRKHGWMHVRQKFNFDNVPRVHHARIARPCYILRQAKYAKYFYNLRRYAPKSTISRQYAEDFQTPRRRYSAWHT